mmetsp:Transcript_71412/g.232051  ORF Transcript_71412/g.232051 Transcript_71412/m.232051 type:complete len:294 (-) Transcript_71412:1002-1883(-)
MRILQGIPFPGKADVEDTTFEHVLAQLVASLGLPALFLGLLPLLCLAIVERHPLAWRARSVRLEGQILLGHLPAQAREDELVGVVLGDAIKVAAVPVHVGGPGHPDAHVEVVLPAEDLHGEVARKSHRQDVPGQRGLRSVPDLALVAVGECAHARGLQGAEMLQDRRSVPRDLSAVQRPNLQDVVLQDGPEDGDVVRGRQTVCVGRGQVARLNADFATLDDPDLALTLDIHARTVEGLDMRVPPEDALPQDGGYRHGILLLATPLGLRATPRLLLDRPTCRPTRVPCITIEPR